MLEQHPPTSNFNDIICTWGLVPHIFMLLEVYAMAPTITLRRVEVHVCVCMPTQTFATIYVECRFLWHY